MSTAVVVASLHQKTIWCSLFFVFLLFFLYCCFLFFLLFVILLLFFVCCCFFVILSPDMPAGVVVENLVKLYVELQGCRNDQVELFHFSRPMRQVVSDNNFEGM